MNQHEARVRAGTRLYRDTETAHNQARSALVDAVVDALKAGQNPTEVTNWTPFTAAHVRGLARSHDVPDYLLRRYKSARGWLEASFPGWPRAARALADLGAGLEDEEFTGGVLWYGLTHAGTRPVQKRIITERLVRWATRPGAGQWARRYATTADLAAAIGDVLDGHLPRRSR